MRRSDGTARLWALPWLAMVAACQVLPPAETATAPVEQADFPRGGRRFVVDSRASEIRLLVYRDGPMARFGHNHVVLGRARGDVRVGRTAAESSFRIEIPVESFEVDPPSARAEEGAEFAAEVSDAARNGTRGNLLGAEVLDAAAHPLVRIESSALRGPRWNPEVTAHVSLRGATRELKFPAAVFLDGDALTVIAAFRIVPSEFGVRPFAVLGGAVRVRDAVDVRVRLPARAAGP